MNKFILGAAFGAVVGYCAYKMRERGCFADVQDDMRDMVSKAKKKTKDAIQFGKNEVEYAGEKIENRMND